MNKNIKRIIALTLTISAFSVISAIAPGTYLGFTTKTVYASSYDPSSEELKSLTVKSTNGDTLNLRDDYNGDTVKLNEDDEYYVKLTDDSDGIKINAKAEDSDYIVRIFTSDAADATGIKPEEKISLGKGNATLYIRTYESLEKFREAKDTKSDVRTCKKEYKLNVKKTTGSSYEDNKQDSIYLGNIDLSKGDITFLKQRTSYDVKVDSSVSEIKITAPPENSSDRVRIDGSLIDSGDKYRKTVSLDDGKNEIKIKVTDDKDNQRTYILNVTRGNSSSDNQDKIYLDDLSLSEGDIDFSAEDTSYNVKLDESISSVKITAKPENEEYLVTVNGDEVKPGDDYEKKISLSKGENTVKVVIKDEVNDKKRTYDLTINRGTAEATKQTDNTNTTTNNTNTTTSNTSATTNTTNVATDKKPGWVKTDAGWIYNDENGIKKTGWFKNSDKWYLLDTKGTMLTGWQDIEGKRYSLDVNGVMRTGWYREEVAAQSNANTSSDTSSTTNATATNGGTANTAKTENWYYLNNDGSMKTGWLNDGEKWYYMNTNGIMQKGWLISSNSKYYLNTDGTMAKGTMKIDGKEYKFNNNGVLII